ncbi:MAG: hypothetical protein K2X98_04045 [Alphaproteobacteria bacterium]|nr:hypothetical protein [Alphaproteobacteria bacterium]
MKKAHAILTILLLGISPTFSSSDSILPDKIETTVSEKTTHTPIKAHISNIESQVCSKEFKEISTQWGINCAFYASRELLNTSRENQLGLLFHHFSGEFKARFGGIAYQDFDPMHISGFSAHLHDAYTYLFSNGKVAWELMKLEKKNPFDAVFTRTIIDEKLQDRLNPILQNILHEMFVDGFF